MTEETTLHTPGRRFMHGFLEVVDDTIEVKKIKIKEERSVEAAVDENNYKEERNFYVDPSVRNLTNCQNFTSFDDNAVENVLTCNEEIIEIKDPEPQTVMSNNNSGNYYICAANQTERDNFVPFDVRNVKKEDENTVEEVIEILDPEPQPSTSKDNSCNFVWVANLTERERDDCNIKEEENVVQENVSTTVKEIRDPELRASTPKDNSSNYITPFYDFDEYEHEKDEKEIVDLEAQATAPEVTSNCVWVTNIDSCLKATKLQYHFANYVNVLSAKILTNGESFFGYVVMESPEMVQYCVDLLDNTIFEGKKIGVTKEFPDSSTNDAPKPEPSTSKESEDLLTRRRKRNRRRNTKIVKANIIKKLKIEEKRQKEYEKLKEEISRSKERLLEEYKTIYAIQIRHRMLEASERGRREFEKEMDII